MDAIPIIKRAFIMRALRNQGNYDHTTRAGHHIRMYRSDRDGQIHFRVGKLPGRAALNVCGDAASPGLAIDEINRIVAGKLHREYQLPYKED